MDWVGITAGKSLRGSPWMPRSSPSMTIRLWEHPQSAPTSNAQTLLCSTGSAVSRSWRGCAPPQSCCWHLRAREFGRTPAIRGCIGIAAGKGWPKRAMTVYRSVWRMQGRFGPEEIRFHEDRGRLLRSLGVGPETRASFGAMPDPPQPGDVFLLASDGFWEWVSEDEMEQDLAAASGPQAWLERMESRIRERNTGDHDNYSAIAVACVQKKVTPTRPQEAA